jgi:putative glutamine amidotransferase
MSIGTVSHQEPEPPEASGPWATGQLATGPWAWHDVDVVPDSKVAALYGASPGAAISVKIASGHHQAVARVAAGLVVTASAEDGTVEALEDPGRWVASVQWHPEAPELSAEERIAPFRTFVEVCRSAAGMPG